LNNNHHHQYNNNATLDRITMLDPEDVIFHMVQMLLLVMFIIMEDDNDDIFRSLLNIIHLEGLNMEELRENRERPPPSESSPVDVDHFLR
jgi:hypothetical protein